MPVITRLEPFDGAESKVARLGLAPVLQEILDVLAGFRLEVQPVKDGNGAAAVRRMIDTQFSTVPGWHKKVTGDIDWTKCHTTNGTSVCIGVEVQVSGRSDLVAVDLIHLRNRIMDGDIDVGVLIVPDDELSVFLTDRTANYSEALRHLHAVHADQIPLYVLAFKQDAFGAALAKQSKRASSGTV